VQQLQQVAFKLLGDLLWLLHQPLLELHQLLVQVGQRAMLPCQHLSIPGSAGETAFRVSLLRVKSSTVLHASQVCLVVSLLHVLFTTCSTIRACLYGTVNLQDDTV